MHIYFLLYSKVECHFFFYNAKFFLTELFMVNPCILFLLAHSGKELLQHLGVRMLRPGSEKC